jgi:KilA-N domain
MQGTWVHPYVAIHLAQWLSPRFAVRVSQWVHEWMTQGPRGKAELPFHLRRYLANYNNVPVGHFLRAHGDDAYSNRPAGGHGVHAAGESMA